MNKLVYILTLGIAAIAVTITTTVATTTTGTFTDGVSTNEVATVDPQSVTIDNTVTEGTQDNVAIEIQDSKDNVLGTVSTDATVVEEGTAVNGATATVTGDIAEEVESEV